MTRFHAQTHPEHEAFHAVDRVMERFLGADLRLLYGTLVPILMVVGLIVVLFLNPAKWLVGVVTLVEIAGIALVVAGIYDMMRGD